MADRTVKVDLVANVKGYTNSVDNAANKTDELNRAADRFDGRNVKAKASVDTAGAHTKLAKMRGDLNAIDGTTVTANVKVKTGNTSTKIAAIAAGIGALGPAAATSAAVATGAVGGLTTILGVAAAGAGSALLAFNGMGDAISAVKDHAADPTAESLEAMNQALSKLTAEGQSLAKFMAYEMTEALTDLQERAQRGMLPGVEEGLESALSLMPQVQRLVDRTSEALGELARRGGEALDSPFWRNYVDFIASEAGPTLTGLGDILGNLAKGFAGLQMAFAPVSRDMISGLQNMSQAFADWATTLDSNQGFQEFIAYVRENGPLLVDTLGSIGGALVSIVDAAMPLGPVALTAIKGLADAINALMSTDAGPWIMGLVGALGALNLAMKGVNAVRFSALGTAILGAGNNADKTSRKVGKLTGMLGRVGGPAAAAAIGIGLAAAAHDYFNVSLSEGADALTTNTAAAAANRAEMERNSATMARNREWMPGWLADLEEGNRRLFGLQTTQEMANEELERQIALMPPLEAASARVAQAQVAYNDALREHGPMSQQAIAASERLAAAKGEEALQTQLAGLAGDQYAQKLGEIAQQSNAAGEAARRHMAGMSATELAAAGATLSVDQFGNSIAVLPDGKTVVINAETMDSSTQIASVGQRLDSLPPNTPVRVNALTQEAVGMLRSLGLEVTQLPDGSFEVIARTEQARQNAVDLGLQISGMKPKFSVGADLTPAEGDIHRGQSLARQRQTFVTDSDVSPANAQTSAAHDAAATPETFGQFSNVSPAAASTADVHSEAAVPEVFMQDSDTGPAQTATDSIHRDSRVSEIFNLDADTSPAMAAIRAVKSLASRAVSFVVNAISGNALGSVTYPMANGGMLSPHVIANAPGNYLSPYNRKYGDKTLRTMPAGGARMVAPNSWRVVGDRMDVPELYAPLDGSGRSLSLIAKGAETFGKTLVDTASIYGNDAKQRRSWSGNAPDHAFTFISGGGSTTETRMNDKAKAAKEILGHLNRGGSLFEDFSFRGNSDLVRNLNDVIADAFYGATGFDFGAPGTNRAVADFLSGYIQDNTMSVNRPTPVNIQREVFQAGQAAGSKVVNINAPIHNPIAERGSASVQNHLSRMADLGMFE